MSAERPTSTSQISQQGSRMSRPKVLIREDISFPSRSLQGKIFRTRLLTNIPLMQNSPARPSSANGTASPAISQTPQLNRLRDVRAITKTSPMAQQKFIISKTLSNGQVVNLLKSTDGHHLVETQNYILESKTTANQKKSSVVAKMESIMAAKSLRNTSAPQTKSRDLPLKQDNLRRSSPCHPNSEDSEEDDDPENTQPSKFHHDVVTIDSDEDEEGADVDLPRITSPTLYSSPIKYKYDSNSSHLSDSVSDTETKIKTTSSREIPAAKRLKQLQTEPDANKSVNFSNDITIQLTDQYKDTVNDFLQNSIQLMKSSVNNLINSGRNETRSYQIDVKCSLRPMPDKILYGAD